MSTRTAITLMTATILAATLAGPPASGATTIGASDKQLWAHLEAANLAPGWEATGDRVVWGDGAVILTLRSSLGIGNCFANYVCVWDHANFGNPILQFRDPGTYNLTSYGFNDRMSSWYNRKSVDAHWYYDVNRGGQARCMNAGTKSSYVDGTDNDKMSSLYIYTTSNAC